jgi:hypothetical protein
MQGSHNGGLQHMPFVFHGMSMLSYFFFFDIDF